MPIFDVEANGRQLEVEAPSLAAAMAALGGSGAPASPAAGPPPASTAEDVVKSAGIGAAEGAIGVANIPELGARAIDYMVTQTGKKLGLGELRRPGGAEPTFEQRFAGSRETAAPTYDQQFPYAAPKVQAAIEQYTGPFYKPQTPQGEVARELGTFASGALGGPGGIGTRIATGVVAPYLATKGAEAATQGTEYETASKLAAALMAPTIAGRAIGARAAAPKVSTTPEELRANAGAVYEAEANTAVNTAKVKKDLQAFESNLYKNRSPEATPGADDILDRLKAATSPSAPQFKMQGLTSAGTAAPQAPTMAVKDLRVFRGDAEAIAGNYNLAPAERAVARQVKGFIDKQLDDVSPALRQANADYAAGSRALEVRRGLENAQTNAAAANSGRNIGNAIRQTFKPDVKQPYGFKPNEVAELNRLVRGDFATNRVRDAANLMGGGGGLGQYLVGAITGGGGILAGGPLGAAAGPATMVAGRALKGMENRMTKAQAERVIQTILGNAPSAQKSKMTSPAIRMALARALLAGAASR